MERDSNGRAAKKVLQLVNPNLSEYLAGHFINLFTVGRDNNPRLAPLDSRS